MKTKYLFNLSMANADFRRRIEAAYQVYASLPMPKVDQNHLHDRPKYQLEEEAIRGEISWIARKYGLTFTELDSYIEYRSEELFKKA